MATNQKQLKSKLEWVPIVKMKVAPHAQRELRPSWVDSIATEFNPDSIGIVTVSARDDAFYIIDGQHRVAALKKMGWEDQKIECRVFHTMTLKDEADQFDRLNSVKAVDSFERFKVRITAERQVECAIENVLHQHKLVLSRDNVPGAVGAVGTLRRVFMRSDGHVLGRSLRIIRDAYGDPGFQAQVIDGIGHLCHRYNGQLEPSRAIQRLGAAHGGVNGLLAKAEVLRKSTGNNKAHCVAAAAVEIINRGDGGKKLPSWWKSE